MMLLTLLACGAKDRGPATEPDPVATTLVVEALCKLVEGASHDCAAADGSLRIDDAHDLSVAVFLDQTEETLGQFTFDGRAVVTTGDGVAITTRFQHYGWGADEAFAKGVHYWAVLAGAPIIDWVLADARRPTLKALEGGQPAVIDQIPVGGFKALRGWTFLQGVKVELPHAEILATLAPSLAALSADAPHTVDVKIASEMGAQVYTCHVDGAAAPEVCAAAESAPWPAGIGWELRQIYLLAPSFPDPPPAEAAEEAAAEGAEAAAP